MQVCVDLGGRRIIKKRRSEDEVLEPAVGDPPPVHHDTAHPTYTAKWKNITYRRHSITGTTQEMARLRRPYTLAKAESPTKDLTVPTILW